MTKKTEKGIILIVDDNPTNIAVLVETLSSSGFKVLVAKDGDSALEQVNYAKPNLILLDVLMPGIDGFETCRRLKRNQATKEIPVIFMTALTDTVDKVKGFNVGAVDYITKPIQHEEVLARVTTHLTLRKLQAELQEANETLEQRVVECTAELREALDEVERLKNRLQAENVYLQEEIKSEHNFEDMIGHSDALKKVLNKVGQVASTDATVLIYGETGTGKELLARAIHNLSPRKERPLVKVNCGAISAGLVESELFGHEKGAFTGALQRRTGRFELADGGTIFLDEIAELPLDTQVKILRVLQEQEFERVGSSQPIKVDVRVIAATNRNLEDAVNDSTFRSDLFYRLNVFPLEVPPLRERKSDIPLLVDFFLKKFAKKLGKPLQDVSRETMNRLTSYTWPGNIRELQNVLERAAIIAQGPIIEIDELIDLRADAGVPTAGSDTLQDVERSHILRVLEEANWVIEGKRGAASILGLHPNTLRSRMQKLGIKKPLVNNYPLP